MDCMETMDIVLIQVINPNIQDDTHMKNSAALKRQIPYQQWVEDVKDFNSRPKDMTVRGVLFTILNHQRSMITCEEFRTISQVSFSL